jgi:hypothetical protein
MCFHRIIPYLSLIVPIDVLIVQSDRQLIAEKTKETKHNTVYFFQPIVLYAKYQLSTRLPEKYRMKCQ